MQLFWTIAWKEWLGLRWKLAALAAILVGFHLSLVLYDSTLILSGYFSSLIGYIVIAPIFLAMHAAAGDRAEGTQDFIRGLPVSLGQWGLVRVLATLSVLLTPLVGAGLAAQAVIAALRTWKPDVPLPSMHPELGSAVGFLVVTVFAMWVATSIYLWGTALAMNQPTEQRAGLIAVVSIAVWGAWTIISISLWDNGPGTWGWMYGVTALGPFAGLAILEDGLTTPARIGMGAAQLGVCCLLMLVAACRYGVLEPRRWHNGIRLSSPNQALWWMQCRQAWPLGIAGPLLALPWFSTRVPYEFGIGVGCVWAIVVSTTLFSPELEPQLLTFWRSRPIDPADWFRIKYALGAILMLLCIDLPAALLGRTPFGSPGAGSVSYLICVPALHLAVYSIAVVIVCLVRQVLYSGILSMGAALFIVLFPVVAGERGILKAFHIGVVMQTIARPINDDQWANAVWASLIYMTYTLSLAVMATFVARWAVRRDIAVGK
jgi:hypothetical protein